MQSQLQHINPTACAAFAVTGPLDEARACMRCIRVIPAKSTPEASNQTADAEEVEEEETDILLKGHTNMHQLEFARPTTKSITFAAMRPIKM
jgi:hypothetical protein